MGHSDELRVDRASYQTHADDTHAGLAAHRSNSEQVDRQQSHLQASTAGGAGSDQYAAVQGRTRHQMDDVNTSGTKVTNRTSETADEFINNVNTAANKHIV